MDPIKLLNYLMDECRKEIDVYKKTICGGSIVTFEEYKRLSGVIWGLEIMQGKLKDTFRRMENGEDEHE